MATQHLRTQLQQALQQKDYQSVEQLARDIREAELREKLEEAIANEDFDAVILLSRHLTDLTVAVKPQAKEHAQLAKENGVKLATPTAASPDLATPTAASLARAASASASASHQNTIHDNSNIKLSLLGPLARSSSMKKISSKTPQQKTAAEENAILQYRIEDIKKQIRLTGQTPEKGNALRYQLNDLMRQYKRLTNESPRQKLKYPKTNQPITFADALRMLQSGETVVPLQQDFSKSTFKFHDRDKQLLEVFNEVIAVNFAQRGANHAQAFAVVPGGSGIGKTRFGWEVAQLMSKPRFASTVVDNFSCNPSDIVTEYVYIDFKTSERFTEKFDSNQTPSVRLGGRLAAKALLSKPFQGLATKNASRTLLCKCTASNVLLEVVTRVSARATKTKIVQLVVHMDEFQFFVDSFETPEKGREALKDMIMEVREFMAHARLEPTTSKPRFFIVPILTGTAAYDLSFLTTHRIKLVTISLLPLSEDSSLSMFSAAYEGRFSSELIAEIASQDHFLILLADTGYIPKYIVHLFDTATTLSSKMHWRHFMEKIPVRKDKKVFGGPASAKVIIKLALSGQPVDSAFVLPCGKTVGDLERAGDLFLQRLTDDSERFHVCLPFIQLKAVQRMLLDHDETQYFPAELLFHPSLFEAWTWRKFELMHGHFHAIKTRSLKDVLQLQIQRATAHLEDVKAMHKRALDNFNKENNLQTLSSQKKECEAKFERLHQASKDGFALSEIFCGALGDPKTLSLRVVIHNTQCFDEAHQWVPKRVLEHSGKEPDVCSHVQCKDEEEPISLFNGVFLCCTGNPIFDGRFACSIPARADKPQKNVLVVWQDKHSQISSTTSVTAEEILTWYKNARKVLRKWQEAYWEIVYFFLTNRKLTDKEKLTVPTGLLVVTREQLRRYLGPTLAARGLIPKSVFKKP